MRDVYIVDGSRTPFIRAAGKPNSLAAADLAVAAAKTLLSRQPFAPADIDEVVIGCMIPSPDEANIGRIVALRSGLGKHVMGWTVQRNCASGLQALDSAAKDIAIGRHDLVLAGGTEAMSRAPLMYNEQMVNWFATMSASKTTKDKLKQLLKFKPGLLAPVISLLRGLSDPVVNLSMGQTAEKIADQFNISRTMMDEFAVASHAKAVKGIEAGHFDVELSPLFDWEGNHYKYDNGVRADSKVEKLATLKPVFDKPYGSVTAANSSQITDGAALLLLASEKAVKKFNLKPIAKIVDFSWTALDPAVMGLGPAHCIAHLLKQNKLTIADIDYWEINEAFAAQVLGCLEALDSDEYCKDIIGMSKKIGRIPMDKINIDGGAIAIGHPVGASGARIALHLLHTLERTNATRGIATLCIGGGQGGGILIERIARG